VRRPDSSPVPEENLKTLQQEVSQLEQKDAELGKDIENLISQ